MNRLMKLSARNPLDWTSEEGSVLKNALIAEAGIFSTEDLANEMNEFIAECYKRRA